MACGAFFIFTQASSVKDNPPESLETRRPLHDA